MGNYFLVIHPRDPDYMVPEEAVRRLTEIHAELSIPARLGIDDPRPGAAYEAFDFSISAGPDFHGGGWCEVYCPACGVEATDWGEIVGQFLQGEGTPASDPVYGCGACGATVRVTHLRWEYCGTTRFAIQIGDRAMCRLEMDEGFWRELETIVGAELTYFQYKL